MQLPGCVMRFEDHSDILGVVVIDLTDQEEPPVHPCSLYVSVVNEWYQLSDF